MLLNVAHKISGWLAIVSLLGAFLITCYQLPVSPAITPTPIVVIDPGHGGQDPGAIGAQGVYEKNINLSIGLLLSTLLRQRQIHVYMTRTSDRAPSAPPFHNVRDLRYRAYLARQWHATIFVSIHTNAEPSGIAQGPIVYYASGSVSSWELASQVSNALARVTGKVITPRPIRQLVLQEVGVPAINVEVGFLTHSLDTSRLINSQYQSQLAAAIAEGIMQYLNRGQ